uniref:Interleukin 24 n=1 Tax=Propithecus coquereli TaxID=379532 RepID=A0A2K6F588_PROCO
INFRERSAILQSEGLWSEAASGAACFVSADPTFSLQAMGSRAQVAALPCLSLMLLLWSQLPEVRGQEFRFGSCRAKGVDLQELWEAFWAVKASVVNITKCALDPATGAVQENEMFSISESARRRFLLFQRAFRQLDIEAALTKAFGEVDILLTWMEKFYQL